VPVMLMLVKICLKTTHWFKEADADFTEAKPAAIAKA